MRSPSPLVGLLFLLLSAGCSSFSPAVGPAPDRPTQAPPGPTVGNATGTVWSKDFFATPSDPTTVPAAGWGAGPEKAADPKNGKTNGDGKDKENGTDKTNGNGKDKDNGKDEKEKDGGKDKDDKPPGPRTVFQALRAYCHRLRLSLAGIEEPNGGKKDDAGNNGAAKGSKSPDPTSGDADSNGKDKSNGNGKAVPNPDPTSAAPGGGMTSGSGSGRSGVVTAGGSAKAQDEPKTDRSDTPSVGRSVEARGGRNPNPTSGDESTTSAKDAPANDWNSIHGQATMIDQYHGRFTSPYQGPFSLSPNSENRTSLTSTLFLDARLWEFGHYSAEGVFNPELAGGRGFSGVNGIAGFTNGEITRVGQPQPTPYIARAILRQTWGLGGEQETAEDTANQIAGKRDVGRFTLSVGKFAFTDFFDNNVYSHDPRTQFMNWSMMYNGAWDYPANVRGYTYGLVAELNEKFWAVRYGLTAEPVVANGAPLDPRFASAHGQALEWEGRWGLEEDEHPGHLRLLAFLNRADMGNYGDALRLTPVNPDVTATRAYRYKYGFGISFDQELTRDLGAWARVGWNDGHSEAWAFTPIDRSLAGGLLLKGRRWARPDDTIGLGVVANGLAKSHREYLAAGGFDFNIGDGRLNYAWERTVETYYRAAVTKNMFLTFDYQYVINPAYNRDRGPVSVYSVNAHIEF
jgi:high affinity Mn2+ porin